MPAETMQPNATMPPAGVGQLDGRVSPHELDSVPKRVLHQISARQLREYVCLVRAERNKYRSLYASHKAKADRLEQELADARDACRRMAAELRANVIWANPPQGDKLA